MDEDIILDCNVDKDLTTVLVEKGKDFFIAEVYKPIYHSKREVYSISDLMRRCKEYEESKYRG